MWFFYSCKTDNTAKGPSKNTQTPSPKIASVVNENYDLRNDSILFTSATIENFDDNEKSQSVFWLDENRDTILRFYRIYDDQGNLIGAEYYEEDETEPGRDTVYINEEGLKVEASLNENHEITWKSTIHIDANNNRILTTYENNNGASRGFDSLYYDNQNREIKGFYENANGKRYGIKTYKYLKEDNFKNWTERQMYIDDTLRQKQIRRIKYFK